MGIVLQPQGQRDAVRDGEADPRVVAAHGKRAPLRVLRCAHDWGRVAARHCGAVCVVRGGGMPAIVREVADTELLDWEEVAYVAARWERMAAACGGRARRSRGLCWRGAC
ncbi:putative elongation factor 1-gamma (EF-1-gamma) [Trypanosoma cruzi]|nr:putative elongation factor 1-gamma (EF-1-gamma) [Trypanosoma cruzi]